MSKPESARRSSQITARLIYVQRSPASSFPRDALLGRYSSPAGVTRTASGSLIVPGVRRQHPERRDQNSLRLLLPHRPTTPPPPNCPLSDAPLQADHMPHTRARRAGMGEADHRPRAAVLRSTRPPPCSCWRCTWRRRRRRGRAPYGRGKPARSNPAGTAFCDAAPAPPASPKAPSGVPS